MEDNEFSNFAFANFSEYNEIMKKSYKNLLKTHEMPHRIQNKFYFR